MLGGATPPAAFDVLLNLDGTRLTNALTQISGETATGAQQSAFNAATMFMAQMTDPFNAGRSDAATSGGTSSFAAEAGLRGEPLRPGERGLWRHRQGDAADALRAALERLGGGLWRRADHRRQCRAGPDTTTSRIYGGIGGADYRLSPDMVAGFALAGGGTNFSVANGGSGRADLFQAGAFVRHNAGACYFAGALAYGWQDVTTDRTVTVAGIDRLQAPLQCQYLRGPRRRRLPFRQPRGSASRPTPQDRSRRSSCRPMPKACCPAPTHLR